MPGPSPEIALVPQPDARIAIVAARWHADICDDLIAGAKRALAQAQVSEVIIAYVPGSFELPLAAQLLLDQGYDAAIVVGIVLKGETPHFDYVCNGVTDGVMTVSLSRSKPVGFGVLMVNTLEQAYARAGRPDSFEDKGYDAAVAALKLLEIKTA